VKAHVVRRIEEDSPREWMFASNLIHKRILRVKVKITAYLKFRALIGESLSFELSGDRVILKDFLKELSNRYGEKFDDLVFEPQRRNVKRAVLILINGQSYLNLKYGLNTELREGDEIQLLPVLAGG